MGGLYTARATPQGTVSTIILSLTMADLLGSDSVTTLPSNTMKLLVNAMEKFKMMGQEFKYKQEAKMGSLYPIIGSTTPQNLASGLMGVVSILV